MPLKGRRTRASSAAKKDTAAAAATTSHNYNHKTRANRRQSTRLRQHVVEEVEEDNNNEEEEEEEEEEVECSQNSANLDDGDREIRHLDRTGELREVVGSQSLLSQELMDLESFRREVFLSSQTSVPEEEEEEVVNEEKERREDEEGKGRLTRAHARPTAVEEDTAGSSYSYKFKYKGSRKKQKLNDGCGTDAPAATRRSPRTRSKARINKQTSNNSHSEPQEKQHDGQFNFPAGSTQSPLPDKTPRRGNRATRCYGRRSNSSATTTNTRRRASGRNVASNKHAKLTSETSSSSSPFQGIISAAESLEKREEGVAETKPCSSVTPGPAAPSASSSSSATPMLLCFESISPNAAAAAKMGKNVCVNASTSTSPVPASPPASCRKKINFSELPSLVHGTDDAKPTISTTANNTTCIKNTNLANRMDSVGFNVTPSSPLPATTPPTASSSQQQKQPQSSSRKSSSTTTKRKLDLAAAAGTQETYQNKRKKEKDEKRKQEAEVVVDIAAKASAMIRDSPDLFKRTLLAMALTRTNPREKRPEPSSGIVIRDGFLWGNYAPLENVLRQHMREYYDMSTNSRQSRAQQEFNNRLVTKIREEAASRGWTFDSNDFSHDRKIRDRIRCFFKTHIQNAKKRLHTMIRNPTKKANARALRLHASLIFAQLENAEQQQQQQQQQQGKCDKDDGNTVKSVVELNVGEAEESETLGVLEENATSSSIPVSLSPPMECMPNNDDSAVAAVVFRDVVGNDDDENGGENEEQPPPIVAAQEDEEEDDYNDHDNEEEAFEDGGQPPPFEEDDGGQPPPAAEDSLCYEDLESTHDAAHQVMALGFQRLSQDSQL